MGTDRMTALNRKLLRDLRRLWGQVLAIGLVIAAGVATVVMALGTLHSLSETRTAYYERYGFGHVFAQAKRAPEAVADRIAEIPGVAQVSTRISEYVILDMPGMDEPARAQIVSLPEGRQPELNRVAIRTGRMIRRGHPGEVLIGEPFAEAHGLLPGDTVTANINGRQRTLTVVGIALAPEFIYVIGPGELVPDGRRFGIIWMGREALEAAFDLEGAFNDVSIGLTRDGSEAIVIEQVDALLERYGGIGAFGRRDHLSDNFVRSEMDQLANLARTMPPIFLLVAAFLLNVVVNRLIETEREQIGLLKAFGYSNLTVGWLYLKLVLAICAVGILIGWGFGAWMGRGVTANYTEYYRFPFLYYLDEPSVFAGAALVSIAAAVSGAFFAVRRAVRLAPAVAMVPPPPTMYRGTLVKRIAEAGSLGPPTRMILRHVTRWPLRSLATMSGIAASVALLVMSLFFLDSIDEMLDSYFFRSQHQDVTVQFTEIQDDSTRYEMAGLPGVMQTELYRVVAMRLRHGHLSRRVAVNGLDPDSRLQELVDMEGRPVDLPPQGITLTAKLAELLAVEEGGTVIAEVLEGRRHVRELTVSQVIQEYIGTQAYMDRAALNRLMGDPPVADGAMLLVDQAEQPALFRELKGIPDVMGAALLKASFDKFQEIIDDTMITMVLFYILFASVIAVGVAYNSARISLSERARELASLRVLGFRKGEVAYILLGELAILTALAMPLGCLFGYGLSALMVSLFESDLYRLPFVIEPSTYGNAVLVVLAASVVTGALVGRRVAQFDLVAVLKTRE